MYSKKRVQSWDLEFHSQQILNSFNLMALSTINGAICYMGEWPRGSKIGHPSFTPNPFQAFL